MAIVGQVIMWSMPQTPQGFMTCDGSLVLIANYPKLFNVLGIYYGGDGVTNFRLPDTRGRFLVGTNIDVINGNAVGASGGTVQTSLAVSNYQVQSNTDNFISLPIPQNVAIIPPFLTVKMCICYDGDMPIF